LLCYRGENIATGCVFASQSMPQVQFTVFPNLLQENTTYVADVNQVAAARRKAESEFAMLIASI